MPLALFRKRTKCSRCNVPLPRKGFAHNMQHIVTRDMQMFSYKADIVLCFNCMCQALENFMGNIQNHEKMNFMQHYAKYTLTRNEVNVLDPHNFRDLQKLTQIENSKSS